MPDEPIAAAAPPDEFVAPPAEPPAKVTDPQVRFVIKLASFDHGRWHRTEPGKMADLPRAPAQMFIGMMASDAYDNSDLSEAPEVGTNLSAMKCLPGAKSSWFRIHRAAKLGMRPPEIWPTQTCRTGEKIAFRQFSTRTAPAYAAVRAANIVPGDVLLEPTDGTGSLAALAKAAGARTIVN